MNWYEILIIVLAAGFVAAVLIFGLVRKAQGKGGCGECGGCTGCAGCTACRDRARKKKAK